MVSILFLLVEFIIQSLLLVLLLVVLLLLLQVCVNSIELLGSGVNYIFQRVKKYMKFFFTWENLRQPSTIIKLLRCSYRLLILDFSFVFVFFMSDTNTKDSIVGEVKNKDDEALTSKLYQEARKSVEKEELSSKVKKS